jgi:hypothetical protein
MAITRKPRGAAAPAVDVDALINRGGSPTGGTVEDPKEAVVPIVLRLPHPMLDQIEAAIKRRPFKTPRHTWILEAIHEKLSRESTD